ncbi:MAG: class I SAM-dependent methyltransferase [Pseudomonadota bacterium]
MAAARPRRSARPDRIEVHLTGVPETMLWPLWNRAAEADRSAPLIDDPLARDLVQRIRYDFRRKFGRPNRLFAVRARVCDDCLQDYLNRCDKAATVIALGEGLETQLYRFKQRSLQWFSVDVYEAIELRRKLLANDKRQTLLACSALDTTWMDRLPDGAMPFISAAGLFMYFKARDVRHLLRAIADRFPGAELFFDTIPPLVSRSSTLGLPVTRHYRAPRMPWGIRIDDIAKFARDAGGWEAQQVLHYGQAYPEMTPAYSLMASVTPLRRTLSGALVLLKAPH